MVQGSFVLSVYRKKGEDELRRLNSKRNGKRFVVVLIAVFVVFGCEYCFDNPSALQTQIQANYLKKTNEILSEVEFNLLYSLYAFPNVIIPLLGGMLIDRIGARIVLIITASFCVLGQLIFGFGGYIDSFTLMLAGRIVFGVGGEVLHAAQNTIISTWFKASELSIILGICISFPKLGSSLNSVVSPQLATEFEKESPGQTLNVAGPIMVGAIIMSISLALAIFLSYIDYSNERKEKVAHESRILSGIEEKKEIRSVKAEETSHVGLAETLVNETGGHLNFRAIAKLPIAFWLIVLISMFSESLFIPFLDNGNKYFIEVFHVSEEQAGIYLILPYCVSSIFVIIFGYLVEKASKRSVVLIASCAFYVLTYTFMMVLETSETLKDIEFVRFLPCVFLGICIALFCSVIVPTIPMLVNPRLLGTAFGIMEMTQNFALGVFPLAGGALRQTKPNEIEGFHFQTLFFFIISCICMVSMILLKLTDLLKGNRLDYKDFKKEYIVKVLKNE